MASTTRTRLDRLYIAFFSISLVSMLGSHPSLSPSTLPLQRS